MFLILKTLNKKKKEKDFDKAAEDLRLATRHLGMIVGKVDVEEILGSIFNDFCIGKLTSFLGVLLPFFIKKH